MINWLIEASLRNRVLVVAAFLLLAGWGYWALLTTPIDAIPDLSDNQVIVFTDWTGRSPQEVEDQVTYPLTVSLQGLPGVRVVRSSSAFGFSMINVIFEDSVDLYFARSRVLERLNLLGKSLPPGVVPTLGPDATGVGHVFWYTVEGKGYSLRDLRSIQDWYIRYQLNSVPGVAEVASVGGTVRQYQIDVDPKRLRAFKIPLSTVVDAVMRSNKNVGGNVVEGSGTWTVIRGLGLVERASDLEQVVIGADNGVPIFVRQVADVKVGDAFRVSALMKGTDGGRRGRGGRALRREHRRRHQPREGEDPGARGRPAARRADRSVLRPVDADRARRPHAQARADRGGDRGHARERDLPAPCPVDPDRHDPDPLAVLTSFLFMRYLGITSNIMSLAGIAIAIGVLVDAAIVVTENAFRFIERRRVGLRNQRAVTATVLEATRLVGRPIFFSMAIIILAFIPVFALTGQEGKLFHPLAFTKTFAMVGATILSVTLVPVLCTLLIGGRIRSEEDNPIMRPLVWAYRPVLGWALRHRILTLGVAVLIVAGAVALLPRIGKEFMPPLNEGDLMFMPITDPAISLPQALAITRKQDAAIQALPEVASVVAKISRADTSTDPAPLNMTETIINLKPEAQWRPGMTREKLIAELDQATAMPGVSNIWTQPIINRINMLTTGIRSEVGVKVFGDDLKVAGGTGAGGRRGAPEGPGRGRRLPGAGHGGALPRHPREPRGGRPLWDHGGRHPGRHRDGGRGKQPDAHHRGPAAVPRARAVRAAVSQRRPVARQCARHGPERYAGAAGPGRGHPARVRPGDDLERERPPRGDRAPERAGARRGQLRRRGAEGRGRAGAAAEGLVHRVERAVRERGAGASSACRSSCRWCWW